VIDVWMFTTSFQIPMSRLKLDKSKMQIRPLSANFFRLLPHLFRQAAFIKRWGNIENEEIRVIKS